MIGAPLLCRLHVVLSSVHLLWHFASDSCVPIESAISGEGGILREWVVVAILNRAVVDARIHDLALLAAIHQVVFIYVFRDGLLAGRLRSTALTHRG